MEFNIADLFEGNVDAIGDRPALVVHSGRRLTYRELDERANRFAGHLRSLGVQRGQHVGLYLYNGTEYLEAMLGALKIRAVPINVNYRYVEGELRYQIDDADLMAMVFARELAPRVAAVRDDCPMLRHLIFVDDDSGADAASLGAAEYEEAIGAASPARDFEPRSPDDLFIIYTGGTTGMPKGVMWRHEDLFFTFMGGGNPLGEPIAKPEDLAGRALARDPQLVQFPIPPLIHGAAQLGCFIGFNWGDKVVLLRKFDPVKAWEAVEAERVNTITIVGDAMAIPMADALEATPDRWDLSSLVYLGSAGALFSQDVKERLRRLLPNRFVTENFGSTESGHTGQEAMEDARPKGGGLRFRMHEHTTVLDDDLKPVEPGSGKTGVIAVGGRIPVGYYKDAEKTARTFVEVDGTRYVIAGDYGTIDADGTVIVYGRGAVCINSGGEKVYPEEVEAAVKAHPAVEDAIIVGVPDEKWGERVAAVVQLRPGASLTLGGLDEHCRSRIAGYKIPRQLTIVDTVARHPSGKPDFPWAREVAAKDAS